MDKNENTTTEARSQESEAAKLKFTSSAVKYILRRVQESENLRYYMGDGTEAFARLVKAEALLTGLSEEKIKTWVYAVKTDRKPDAELVRNIKDALADGQSNFTDARITLQCINSLLGR